MITDVHEGRRIKVVNQKSVTVRFNERHDTLPVVTTLLETDDGTTTSFIQGISRTEVVVEFSTSFSGYLHLQVFSAFTVRT